MPIVKKVAEILMCPGSDECESERERERKVEIMQTDPDASLIT